MNKPATTKKLKAYYVSSYGRNEISDALGMNSWSRQLTLMVAATSQKQAILLMGETASHFRNHGRMSPDVPELLEANPGQVFAARWMCSKTDPRVKVGRTVEHDSLKLDVETDLSLVAEIVAYNAAEKERKEAATAKNKAAVVESREHRERNYYQCSDAIERNKEMMSSLGIHPNTIVVGSTVSRVGVLVPAEVYEKMVAALALVDELGE